ncbi:MAG: hypothetical protein ACLFS1_08500 [Opitutales bacterium]
MPNAPNDLSERSAAFNQYDFSHCRCPVVDTRNCLTERPPLYYHA